MTPFVLDCSVCMTWAFEDEKAPVALDELASVQVSVPQIWPLEVSNSLLVALRHRRISIGEIEKFTETLDTLPIIIDGETSTHALTRTFAIARRYGLTSYDAAYLELALRRDRPLATLDGKLRKAAEIAGVPLI